MIQLKSRIGLAAALSSCLAITAQAGSYPRCLMPGPDQLDPKVTIAVPSSMESAWVRQCYTEHLSKVTSAKPRFVSTDREAIAQSLVEKVKAQITPIQTSQSAAGGGQIISVVAYIEELGHNSVSHESHLDSGTDWREIGRTTATNRGTNFSVTHIGDWTMIRRDKEWAPEALIEKARENPQSSWQEHFHVISIDCDAQ